MRVDNLLPVLERLNRDYTGNIIEGVEYPIEFFIIAPSPSEYHLIVEHYWGGIRGGVSMNELLRGISDCDVKIYAKQKSGKFNDFIPIDDKFIQNIISSVEMTDVL